MLAFLREQRIELTSEQAQLVLEKVGEGGTMPIYDSLTNVISKAIAAPGTNYYFEFSDPTLQEDFDAYLKDNRRTGQTFFQSFNPTWFKQAQVGFQGVFLVDLPVMTDANAEELLQDRPRPFYRYVASSDIHDIEVNGNRVEYLILWQQTTADTKDFWVWDDSSCYRVRHQQGEYIRLTAEDTQHELGYVPAYPVTAIQPDERRPVLRSSFLAKSLPLANVYLRDFCNHELGKARFANPKPWSYGVKCDHTPPPVEGYRATCDAGWLHYPGIGKQKCPRCKGMGRYIPYGRDEGYILEVPEKGDEPITPPAGYVIPDLKSLKYIGDELVKNEAKIEKAVLGKEGILAMQSRQETALGKTIDLGPMEARLSLVADNWIECQKFVLNTFAVYRYREQFLRSSCNAGRRWTLLGAAQLEADFAAAKKAGLDESILYSYLEDIIYTKYANDPMELQRNLLKLELTPFPTCTVEQARADGVATAYDLALKRYLNDLVVRFEEENGSILEFGSLLAPSEKLRRIREQFSLYLTDIAQRSPVFTLMPPLNAPAAAVPATAPAFTVGDAVMVKPGMAHMPAHEGLNLTIAQVQGDTYAVKLPDGSVHKWYTTDELMGMSPATKPAKAPEMAM
ncbi:hypothetical protein [Hymenobacter guriensis]|uniref:Uncharacterized protein n=1 Tax=Hymenobacter guriensis TaxID=2793065 RepID=A0ABS0L8E0_9BACT|nr:hypothetical protein [Hymenobacter guriensis]MBG8556170.1 hypothetical protein [Hymenobacter guriensis]